MSGNEIELLVDEKSAQNSQCKTCFEKDNVIITDLNAEKDDCLLVCPCVNNAGREKLLTTEDVCDNSNFDHLPVELVYKIMSNLTPMELCRSVAPVCKLWRDVAYDPILWQQLEICGRSCTMEMIIDALDRAPCLRSLQLRRLTDIRPLMPTFQNLNSLLHLDVGLCNGVDAHFLSHLNKCNPHLKSLNLEGCSIDNVAVFEIIKWKKLQSLNISHCTNVSDESIFLIAMSCVLLQHLNIDEINRLTDCAILVLIQERKDTLTQLHIDGEELTDIAYKEIGKCKKLTEFGVSFAELMTDDGLSGISELSFLNSLKIKRGAELSAAGLKALFDGENLHHLRVLDLNSCRNLNDDGVISLSKCCSELHTLDLAWCWDVTDIGLEAIIQHCRCLRILSIIGLVEITGDCLPQIPETMPLLKFLDLQQCPRVEDDIVKDIVTRKPSLKVLDYYGYEVIPFDDS